MKFGKDFKKPFTVSLHLFYLCSVHFVSFSFLEFQLNKEAQRLRISIWFYQTKNIQCNGDYIDVDYGCIRGC